MGTHAYAAEPVSFDVALNNTKAACRGISDNMAHLKQMAGINTAVTGVGTAAGIGATVTGLVKASKDKKADKIEINLEKLRQIEQTGRLAHTSEESANLFLTEFDTERQNIIAEIEKQQAELDKITKQSKNLGNWRTGLLAGSTATNVAGAIIAGNNKTDDDVHSQIEYCLAAVEQLQNAIGQARIDGYDISHAQEIVRECSEYKYVDLSKIDNKAQGAMIASIVGAATGISGTITSAVANTNAIRNDDKNKQKEKNLNTASNVLAGTTTVASATATAFNATQISAIKKVASIADNCERELSK
ncbi:MAG: hypothetical protein NC311_01970 [Muribaculaceae bacterium]|nr:hypothetical protein [Muribaculaceae bacterium]